MPADMTEASIPVCASPESDEGIALLHEVRATTAAQLPHSWLLAANFSDEYALVLSHLYPPIFRSTESPSIARWRESYGYHKLYYRVGPGFVQTVDYRFSPAGEEAIFEGRDAEQFVSLDLAPLEAASPAPNDFVERLLTLDMYLKSERFGLLLPFRVRRWPIPWISV